MLHDESLFEKREETFKRILEERGLGWKPEEFLGWTHISIYRPGYKFTGWVSYNYKKEYFITHHLYMKEIQTTN